MKQFITIDPKGASASETLSFNPDAISHFSYKEDWSNPSENSLNIVFNNGTTVTLVGKPAGTVKEHLVSLERPEKINIA